MMPATSGGDVRRAVDDFLAENKKFAGEPSWARMDFHEDRCKWAVMASNEIVAEVCVNAYFLEKQPSFGLVLTYHKAIWRVDFGYEQGHENGFSNEVDLPAMIQGPHYHAWADNRQLATANNLPDHLKFANILPSNIKSFDSCFRWFAEKVNIDLTDRELPALPSRGILL